MASTIMNGWRAVLGAFTIHLTLGTLYLWSNITIAVTSYLRSFDSTINYNNTLLVYASSLGAQGIFMLVGGLLEKRYGVHTTIYIGGTLLVFGVFATSFCTTLASLVLFYGIIFGAGIGISYSTPIVCCSRWFPENKGLVTGIIVAGFGSGAFVFGELALSLSNPDDIDVNDDLYFEPDSSVVKNVPRMFQTLACIYAVMIFIASLLLVEAPVVVVTSETPDITKKSELELHTYQFADQVDVEESKNDSSTFFDYDVYQVAKSWLGWHLSFCFVCTAVGGMFMAGNNKVYAEPYFSDTYLSTVISVSSIFNGTGRIMWGALSDYVGSITALTILAGCFSVVLFTYAFIAQTENEILFALWTFLVLLFEGGNFALYLPTTIRLFGNRNASSNYGAIFLSYSLCNFVNIVFLANIGISFNSASVSLGILCFIGFISLCWLSCRVEGFRRNRHYFFRLISSC